VDWVQQLLGKTEGQSKVVVSTVPHMYLKTIFQAFLLFLQSEEASLGDDMIVNV